MYSESDVEKDEKQSSGQRQFLFLLPFKLNLKGVWETEYQKYIKSQTNATSCITLSSLASF